MTILKPYISKQLTGQIWKLEIDAVNDLLFVETRDTENRQALFSGFDLQNGNTNFTNITQSEKWLTGIEGCYNGVLFLHGYQSAQSPQHKGITAINGATGKVLWENYVYAIHHISTNGPVAYNTQIQPPKLFLSDAQNGATLRAFNTSIDTDVDNGINIPETVNTLGEAFNAHITGQLTGNVDYMEYNSFRIVSLHTLNKAGLNQVLLIMQGDKLVYHDLLNDWIQKLQPEAFIMHQNRLIYIKNKMELKVLNL